MADYLGMELVLKTAENKTMKKTKNMGHT